MKRTVLLTLSSLLWLGVGIAMAAPAPGQSAGSATRVYVQWLRVDVHHPRTLFLGGTFACTQWFVGAPCPNWVMRSTDSGVHWVDLRRPLSKLIALFPDPLFTSGAVRYELSPVVLAADGRHAYMDAFVGGSASTAFSYVLWSSDEGRDWQQSAENPISMSNTCGFDSGGAGYSNVALSPVTSKRVYAVFNGSSGAICGIARSNDAGRTFITGGDPTRLVPTCIGICSPWGLLVADPAHLNTVYSNIVDVTDSRSPVFVARSDDAGIRWSTVMTPTASPPLKTFTVRTDPNEGTLLVGRTQDPGVPAERRYLSGDEGRTWRRATCPGDRHGACPAFTVQNVFGTGAAYGFVHDGIYRFHGGGPALARLPLSARLPLRTAALIDVGAGLHAGDPICLLGRGVRGRLRGLLYRSTDGGHTWQRLLAGAFPLGL